MTLQGLQKALAALKAEPSADVEIIVDGEGFEIDEVSFVNGRVVIDVEEDDEEFI